MNEEFSDTETLNVMVQVDWELDGGATVTSVTGYSEYDVSSLMDGDTSDLHLFEARMPGGLRASQSGIPSDISGW